MTMRVQVAIPEEYIDKPVLDSALEAVTRLNEEMIANRDVPLFTEAVNRVRWKAEPPGQEHFDHARTVLERGHGDCDDLAPWHAASLRATGEDPGANAITYQSGPKRWHAVVERSDGSLEDPSLSAGMRGHSGIKPAAVPLMEVAGPSVGAYLLRPQIALRPVSGGWQARSDLPWQWHEHVMEDEPTPLDYAMTALHTAPLASTALVGSLMGVLDLAGCAGAGDEEHIERLEAMQAAAEGWPYEDIEDEWGTDHANAAQAVVGAMYSHVGFGWGDIADLAVNYGLPVAASIVPGASLAVPFAQGAYRHVRSQMNKPKGGGAPAPQGYAAQAPAGYAAPQASYAPQAPYPPQQYAQQWAPSGGAGPGRLCLSFG